MMRRLYIIVVIVFCGLISVFGQRVDTLNPYKKDSLEIKKPVVTYPVYYDTTLRIINLSPFFSIHVDSNFSYQLRINKNPKNYYWYIKNSPAGLKIDKDNGMLSFKSSKSLFLSGRLKYDVEYPAQIGVQNLSNQFEKVDTSFLITFYNTDVILPRIKPSVLSPVIVEEGNRLSFNVMCENGNFPIDKILFSSNITLSNYKLPKECDDRFEWTPPYDFVNDKDKDKQKTVDLYFVGTSKFNFSDTAIVKVIVKDAMDYDIATRDYVDAVSEMKTWILQLKYTFLQLDRKIRKTKSYRTSFDVATGTAGVTSTILSTRDNPSAKNTGKVLPSVSVALVPIKEAAAPNKTVDQNQATLVRSTIKRLEYMITDNKLSGERDPQIVAKTETLRKELRQSKNQLADVPTEISESMSEKQLNNYFDSPRVQRKYRMK
jgi:hypothetical protein